MRGRRSKPKARRIVLAERPGSPPGEAALVVGSSKHLQELIDLLRRNNLTELELEHQGVRIRLRHELTAKAPVAVHQESVPTIPLQPSQAGSSTIPVQEGTAGFVTITSPIVGTFYRSPSPDADSYVDEGDFVKKGQVLCIVEAMKLMNEIESELDGRIVKILVENTKSVEYGQALFLIDPKATP
ncbi:MAG: acetyl-CoA carboxylase biotin carboxyl carrier protein [Nitrospira sp.]|nr:acetyl-CoA carboxylase biotin carboxyl carrier protein [Nitrospira sp.]MDH4302761.1 acetyl-CoA carboxylase biotin carboxyl carrier protein [Nitrospira sp.]MDH5192161.1 acetyl-CoA carboxylase biotin carboxyl carrier protein [Nitrospira sp.]